MIGLSLCGGGSKGSYEQGVWKALRELGIEFDIVTGSSIGAFNGAMITQGQYEECSLLWDKITIHNVMNNGFELEKFNLKQFITHDQFKVFLKHYIKQFRTDITPLKALLNEYLNPELLRNSKIKFGINTTKFPSLKKEEVVINDLSDYDMYHYILATASIFPVFPICYINNKQYIDGGYSDNLPIDFAFKLGATTVIAVDLNHNITHKHHTNSENIIYIYPKWDLGSFLYFDRDSINKNKELGYYDTYKKYGYYEGFRYIFKKNKLKDLANLITVSLIEDETHFRNTNLKYLFKKTDYKDVFSYLNKHIYGKVKDNDYLLKTLEELLYIYEYNILEIYSVKSTINSLINLIKKEETQNFIENLNNIKALSKKREYINMCNKKEILAYVYNNEHDYEFKMFIRQVNVSLYLAIVFVESLGKYNEV